MTFWYMSFVDSESDVFLGSCVVKGENEYDAMTNSWKTGANPGGAVMMVSLPRIPDEIDLNRFYPLAEMVKLGHLDLDDMGPSTRAAYEASL